MVEIKNRQEVFKQLNCLKIETLPAFGKMTAQHMVEHLNFSIKFSNGTFPQKLFYPQDTATKIKKIIIYSNEELPIGFKAPMLTDNLPDLYFSNLETAIQELEKELVEFDNYFQMNEQAKPINPTMGELDFREWNIFHNKHFTHHFKQFKLI